MTHELFRFLSMPLAHAKRAVQQGNAPEAILKAWRMSEKRFGIPLFSLPEWISLAMHPRITRARIRILREKHVPFTHAVDATGGIGLTSLILAQAFTRVTVFEKDPLRAAFLQKNLALHAARNVTLIQDDSTREKYRGIIASADVVFLDPTRPARSEARSLDEATPRAEDFPTATRIVEDVSPLIPYETLRKAYPEVLFHAYPEGLRHARTAVFHGIPGDVIIGTEDALREGSYEQPHILPLEALDAREGRFLCEASMVWRWSGLLRGEWYGDARRTLRVQEKAECEPFMLARRILTIGSAEDIRAYLEKHPGRVRLKYSVPSEAYHAEAARFAQKKGEKEYAVYKAKAFILTEA